MLHMASINWARMHPNQLCLKKNSGISQFCDFEWFKWVLFQDEMAPYLDNQFKLGRYLVASIDIGSNMDTKIIRDSG